MMFIIGQRLLKKLKGSRCHFKIDRAETQFPDSVDTYAPEVYDKAKEIFEDMVSDGTYITDSDECYYIYSLVMDGRRQTGIAACASVDDYMNNVIKNMKIQEKKRSRTVSDMWIRSVHRQALFSLHTGLKRDK